LDIIGDFASASGCASSLFNASLPLYASASAQEMGGYDTAAVVAVLREMAGLSR